MLNTIPAKKLGMTSVFDGAGTTMPATVMEPFDLYVVQKKTVAKDGYFAVVLAFQETTPKHLNKPKKGQLAKAGIEENLRNLFEVKVTEEQLSTFTLGQQLKPEEFLPYWGEATTIAISKGKGFQGVMKRHNFKGVKMTHGHTIHRKPASGGATDPARQLKGSRRPGRMGNERVTIKNLTVFEYNRLHNILVLQGTVPGPKGGLVWVKRTKELDKEIVDMQYQDYLEAKAEEEAEAAAEVIAAPVAAPVEEVQEPEVASAEAPVSETAEPEAIEPSVSESKDAEPAAVETVVDSEPTAEESIPEGGATPASDDETGDAGEEK